MYEKKTIILIISSTLFIYLFISKLITNYTENKVLLFRNFNNEYKHMEKDKLYDTFILFVWYFSNMCVFF